MPRRRVAVIGVGFSGFRPVVHDQSFREMMFEAAMRAYEEAGIEDPRSEVDVFISCQEDYWEGIAIADEFAPEPIGGVLRPTFTVSGDGLQGLAQAVMLVETGHFDIALVESHARPSDIVDIESIYHLALDPIYLRPILPKNRHLIPGLDATAFLDAWDATLEDLALVAVKNRRLGLTNPHASYSARLTVDDVLESPQRAYPLTEAMIARLVDGAVAMVVASEEAVDRLGAWDKALWIMGTGYATETYNFEKHLWGTMPAARIAAREAMTEAGVRGGLTAFDVVEVDDRYSYTELLMLAEAFPGEDILGLHRRGETWPDGLVPVNPSGGSLAWGVPFEAAGLARLAFAREYLLQLGGGLGLVMNWRGPPTYTVAATVVGVEEVTSP